MQTQSHLFLNKCQYLLKKNAKMYLNETASDNASFFRYSRSNFKPNQTDKIQIFSIK
jgi:hypothetical protein